MGIFNRLFRKSESSAELLCPHCERSLEGHDVDACARKRMSRRFFFGILGGAAAIAALPKLAIPEGEVGMSTRFVRMYDHTTGQFVDRMDVLYGHGNTLSAEQITTMTLETLRKNLRTATIMHRYDAEFATLGNRKIGNAIGRDPWPKHARPA